MLAATNAAKIRWLAKALRCGSHPTCKHCSGALSLDASFALPALDAQLDQGASQRGVGGGDFFVGEFFFEPSLGALPGFFGFGFVNLVGLNRQIGEDRDTGGRDFDQSSASSRRTCRGRLYAR